MKATDFNLKKFYLKEGWSKLPNIDREKYQPRDGLEGPIMTRSGKVVYYDHVEGKYYDPDTDMYLTYDEWKAFDPELPIKKEHWSQEDEEAYMDGLDLMNKYKENEKNNYHSENDLLLAKSFGTDKEVQMMELIIKKNKRQGYTSPEDSKWMYNNINKKYYPKLVQASLEDDYNESKVEEDGSSHTSMNKYGLSARHHEGKFYSYRHGKMTGVFDSMEELAKHQEELINNESNTSIFDESWGEGCECCGCETQKECTCEADCPDCNCHSGVKEADNPEHGSTEYYRNLDKGQLNHTKSMLMKTAGQLNVAIEQRYKFSKELMGNTGDRAGTGDLQKMLDTINHMISIWDEETKLYGK